jgi:hypothetical protein
MDRFSKLIRTDNAPRAAVLHAARYEALFRVIGNICGKNGIDQPNSTICTNHLYTILSCLNERLQDSSHALMKQLIAFELTLCL